VLKPQPILAETPFPFQQNPCTFPSWILLGPTGGVVEIEEAAADMFLNWVYRRTETGGFSNTLWRGTGCYSGGCAEATPIASGDARFIWMNDTIDQLMVEFGW
jgi:hypothetical protein